MSFIHTCGMLFSRKNKDLVTHLSQPQHLMYQPCWASPSLTTKMLWDIQETQTMIHQFQCHPSALENKISWMIWCQLNCGLGRGDFHIDSHFLMNRRLFIIIPLNKEIKFCQIHVTYYKMPKSASMQKA